MQLRHKNRVIYFHEQSECTRKYVIPYIEQVLPVTPNLRILEIGCGEGGNLKPFLQLGCQCVGVDIDVEETGTTFEENSLLKAEAVMKATGLPALADDSGIAVDALNGEPGIYSARYGFDDSLDDHGRLLLLLKYTEHVPDGQRQAQFVCVITMLTPAGPCIQARGEVHGELTREPRGENGFGYDPVFYVDRFEKTLAEVTPEGKNSISHRGKALAKMKDELLQKGLI